MSFLSLSKDRKQGEKQRTYTCCNESVGSPGCVKGPHVYKGNCLSSQLTRARERERERLMRSSRYIKDDDIQEMHAKIPYVRTPPKTKDSRPETWCSIVALDCEMVYIMD